LVVVDDTGELGGPGERRVEVVVCAARATVDEHQGRAGTLGFDVELAVTDVDTLFSQRTDLIAERRNFRNVPRDIRFNPHDVVEDRLPCRRRAAVVSPYAHRKTHQGQRDRHRKRNIHWFLL